MKIVRPTAVTPAMLTTNVAEPGTSPATYLAGTAYSVGNTASYNHIIYSSLQNANTGHTPDISPTWWQATVPTNTWAMFDNYANTQTTNANTIAVTLVPATRVDSLFLNSVSCASIRVQMTDAIDGTVFDTTYSMVSTTAIVDWSAYFFEPITRLADLIIDTLPPGYSNPTLNITLTDTGNTAKCGTCMIGLSKEIGATQYGLKMGIIDYSVKSVDAFGNYTIVQRAFAKKMDAVVWVDNSYIDQLQTLLASYRSTPVGWIGSDSYASSAIFGFYKDFTVEVTQPTVSLCTISIEGLA